MFVFRDFKFHYEDWLTYSGGTDRTGELCYNFSVSNNYTQIGGFPTQIPDWHSHSHALLDLFFLLTLVYVLQWLSLHREILTMLSQFSLTSPFHCITYDYLCADWDGLHDHLGDVLWEDIFKNPKNRKKKSITILGQNLWNLQRAYSVLFFYWDWAICNPFFSLWQ